MIRNIANRRLLIVFIPFKSNDNTILLASMNDSQGIYTYLNCTYMHKGKKLIAEKSQLNSTDLLATHNKLQFVAYCITTLSFNCHNTTEITVKVSYFFK